MIGRIIENFKQGREVARRDNSDPTSFEEGTQERFIAEHAQEAGSLDEFTDAIRGDSRIFIESKDALDQAIDFYQENYTSE